MCKAGDGGAGSVSFRREAHVSRGGPDGGDGGDGGDVWLVATTNQASLLGFRDHPHRRATDGKHGQGKKRHGPRGPGPRGPRPGRHDGARPRRCGARRSGHRRGPLAGGRGRAGGRGNARFLSNRRRAPAFAEQGEKGEERWLDLELKLLADVALVGLPNSGKSTLISRISAARPKVAAYPFTTLEPHLGVVRVGRPGDETEFVVADVPGLVEGAAEGRGLGHRFLRHVERARALVVLLDLAPADEMPASEQERILLAELGRYRPELLERPRHGASARSPTWPPEPAPDGLDLTISAVTGAGIPELLVRLAGMVVEARAAEAVPEPVRRDPPPVVGGDRSGPGRGRVVRGARSSRPAGRGVVRPQRPRCRGLRPDPSAQARRRARPRAGRDPRRRCRAPRRVELHLPARGRGRGGGGRTAPPRAPAGGARRGKGTGT